MFKKTWGLPYTFFEMAIEHEPTAGKNTRTLSMTYNTFREFTKKVVQIMLTSWRPKAPIQNTECVLSSTISDFPVNPFFHPATVLDTNTNHSNPNQKLLTVCHLPTEKSLVFKYWYVWHVWMTESCLWVTSALLNLLWVPTGACGTRDRASSLTAWGTKLDGVVDDP